MESKSTFGIIIFEKNNIHSKDEYILKYPEALSVILFFKKTLSLLFIY